MNSFFSNIRHAAGIAALCAAVLFAAAYVSHNRSTARGLPLPPSPTMETLAEIVAPPAPVPPPFAEMTIPYLRERSYASSLGALERYASYAAYTSYTTSYDSDGLNVDGLLTIPKGIPPEGGWPAIVFIHGYIPPDQYKTTANYVSYVDYLAERKFVVFKIDLRGHGDSEGEPSGAYYSSGYVIDALNAYAALESASFVNPGRIGLWGHSMAGNIVLRAFAARPGIPAAVIWAGAGYTYTDLREYSIDDHSYRPLPQTSEGAKRRIALREVYGEFSETSDFWRQVAPTNYLADLRGALQLHHAVDDAVVSVNYSRNLNRLLDQTAATHELNEYDSGGHNINSFSFVKAMQNTVEFFQEYL